MIAVMLQLRSVVSAWACAQHSRVPERSTVGSRQLRTSGKVLPGLQTLLGRKPASYMHTLSPDV